MYYLCSKNKGANQMHSGYLASDLGLYFRICKKACFLMMRLKMMQTLPTVTCLKLCLMLKGSVLRTRCYKILDKNV